MYFPHEQEAVTFWIHIKLLAHTVPHIRKREMGKKKNLSFRKKLIPKVLSPNQQTNLTRTKKKNSKIMDFFFQGSPKYRNNHYISYKSGLTGQNYLSWSVRASN